MSELRTWSAGVFNGLLVARIEDAGFVFSDRDLDGRRSGLIYPLDFGPNYPEYLGSILHVGEIRGGKLSLSYSSYPEIKEFHERIMSVILAMGNLIV